MRERPILFNGDMVRAILAGTKTQTRRPVKQVPHWDHCGKDIMEWDLSDCYTDDDGRHWLDIQTDVDDNSHEEISCPFGQPGDRLWVRETWWQAGHAEDSYPGAGDYEVWVGSRHVHYAANGNPPNEPNRDYPRGLQGGHFAAGDKGSIWLKRPSIHMPRWACRLVLEIVSVRVEQAYLISDADARAEGFSDTMTFKDSWDDIYGKGAKDAAFWGWCWVIEFKRVAATEVK